MTREEARERGWRYHYSHALGMEYAVRHTANGPVLVTSDRVTYSPEELRIVSRAGEIDPAVHEAKRVFEGRIVR